MKHYRNAILDFLEQIIQGALVYAAQGIGLIAVIVSVNVPAAVDKGNIVTVWDSDIDSLLAGEYLGYIRLYNRYQPIRYGVYGILVVVVSGTLQPNEVVCGQPRDFFVPPATL